MLELWIEEFDQYYVDRESFPTLAGHSGFEDNLIVIDRYKTILPELEGKFENRFMDFKNIKDNILAFSANSKSMYPVTCKLRLFN